jgi:hypothetical protein
MDNGMDERRERREGKDPQHVHAHRLPPSTPAPPGSADRLRPTVRLFFIRGDVRSVHNVQLSQSGCSIIVAMPNADVRFESNESRFRPSTAARRHPEKHLRF